jgi:hypothetical protein
MYIQLIGSLMYLVNTRLDTCFAVNTLSQYMVEPRHVHWRVAKHVLRYLHGSWIWIEICLEWRCEDCRFIQTLTGKGVQWTGKAHQDFDSRRHWNSVQQRQSI